MGRKDQQQPENTRGRELFRYAGKEDLSEKFKQAGRGDQVKKKGQKNSRKPSSDRP